MSKTTIPTSGITADAIDATLVADDAISEEHLDATAITGTTELAVQPAAADEIIISDAGTLKRLDIKHISNTPSFLASLSSDQAISNNSRDKVLLDAEYFDSDGKFASNKFTPTIAGKYYIAAKARCDTSTNGTATELSLFKNGSKFTQTRHTLDNSEEFMVAAIMDLDADDFVEFYAYQNSGGSTVVGGGTFGSDGTTAFMMGWRLTGL